MSRFKKLIRTLIALLVLASSLFSISLAILGDYDPVAIAVAFQDDNKRDQALETIDFSLEYGHGNADELKQLKDEYEYGPIQRSKDFLYNGVVKGEVYNTWSGMGCVASDCLLIGDVRDLTVEGYHWASGDEVNKAVVALSGIGVASTVAETTGVGVVLDASASLLKTAAKYVGRTLKVIPDSILKTVLNTSRNSTGTYQNLWEIYKNTGFSIQSFTTILTKVKKVEYLPQLNKMVASLKKGSASFITQAGEGGIKLYDRFGDIVLTGFKKNPRGIIGLTKFHTFVIGGAKSYSKHGATITFLLVVCGPGMLLAFFPVWVPVGLAVVSSIYLFKKTSLIRRSAGTTMGEKEVISEC